MSIALLATGDELVTGDTLNTNSQQLAHALNSEGLILGFHLICGDQENTIFSAMQFLAEHHDILIVTGGLGPTSDDRTRFALAQFMKISLQEYPTATEHIEKRLHNAHLPMTKENRHQAMFPPNAILLPNPLGTAMGCHIKWNDKLIFLLPGPPRECLPMFNEHVLPSLQSTKHTDTVLLKWRLFGTAEGQIAQQFDEALRNINCETGYRLEMPYLECKVRCAKELVTKVNTIVEPLVAPYLIATPEQKASEKLALFLTENNILVSICDKATGGTLQTLLQNPTNVAKISFFNRENDNSDFYFRIEGLGNYWEQKNTSEKPYLMIECVHQGKITKEHHILPYRSSLLLHHAAEWLCFRLFHLINTLH